MQREYGRSPRGEIIKDIKRGHKFERINIIGALCDGKCYGIECYNQSTDSKLFEYWFKEYLLTQIPQGFTIILDNARFHRKKILKKIARGKVRLLFLPPYSPDYNPIEKDWANMRRFVCNNIQNYESLESTIYDYFGVSEY